MSYEAFLARKRMVDPATGMTAVPTLPSFLFPHQADIVSWALRRGRAAVFAGTGLGKTAMELSWADAVSAYTDKPVLVFAPLAVASQHIREAGKFNIPARLVRSHDDVRMGVNVTNYQKIEHFDLSEFGGVVLDESSILKSTDGKYRTRLIEQCASVPFRLAATATPAPNDFMELGNHAEFIGAMSYTDMLATFFTHDGGETQKWRLKGHAETEFWKWMASWAVMLRKPSDLGYPDTGYDLPPLRQVQHLVAADYAPSLDTGLLFPMEARTMQERLGARRDTVAERVEMAVSLVTAYMWAKLPECHGNPNTKQTDSTKLAAILSTLRGSKKSEAGRPTKTGSTCALTTPPTKENGRAVRQKSKPSTTPNVANDTLQTLSSGIKPRPTLESERQTNVAHPCFVSNTSSPQPSTTTCSADRMASALSASGTIPGDGSTLTIATIPASFEGFSVPHATPALGTSKTIPTASLEPSSTFERLDRW